MYTGPVHITVVGQVADKGDLIIFARKKAWQLMDHLIDTGEAAGNQKFTMRDNATVTIAALISGGQRTLYVTIQQACAIHMDSGIADLINIAPLNPDRYANAKLLVGGNLKNNKFWGDIDPYTGIGRTKIPVGSLDVNVSTINSPVAVSGQEIECLQYVQPPKSANVDQATWDSQVQDKKDALWGKKVAVAYAWPSYFSGKMRLYIQAVHARNFNDPVTSVVPVPSLELLNVAPVVLQTPMYDADGKQLTIKAPNGNDIPQYVHIDNNSTFSTGIYTDDKCNYWFVAILYGPVTTARITRMKLSDCGHAAQAYILRHVKTLTREQKAQYEALALSTGIADGTMSFDLPAGIKFPAVGAALAYGWTFKWDGSEAHIIAHDRTSGFVAYHLAVTLHRNTALQPDPKLSAVDQERTRWTMKGSVVEGGNAWRSKTGMQNVWAPAWNDGGVYEIVDTPDEVACFGDAPLYCFYDKADTLQILRYRGANIGPHTDANIPPCYPGGGSWVPCAPGGGEAETKTYSTDQVGSFSCNGTVVQGRSAVCWRDYSTLSITPRIITPYQYSAKQNHPPYSDCATRTLDDYNAAKLAAAPSVPFDGWNASYQMATTVEVIESGAEQELRFAAIVIPWGDCAAVYMAQTGYRLRNGNHTLSTGYQWVISENSKVGGGYFPITGAAGPYFYNNADQGSVAGIPEVDTSVTTSLNDNTDLGSFYYAVGYDGVPRSTDKGQWNQNLMNPSLHNLSDQHSFSTTSSAVFGDVVGMGFRTGGYPDDTRGPNYEYMVNRAFIGFA